MVAVEEFSRGMLGARGKRVSRRPTEEFHALFDRLGSLRDGRVDAMIRSTSDASNPAEPSSASSIRRDSRSHISNWKRRLSSGEIERVRAGTDAIASRFYGFGDW